MTELLLILFAIVLLAWNCVISSGATDYIFKGSIFDLFTVRYFLLYMSIALLLSLMEWLIFYYLII
jgi:hypothetical protein